MIYDAMGLDSNVLNTARTCSIERSLAAKLFPALRRSHHITLCRSFTAQRSLKSECRLFARKSASLAQSSRLVCCILIPKNAEIVTEARSSLPCFSSLRCDVIAETYKPIVSDSEAKILREVGEDPIATEICGPNRVDLIW